MGKSTPDEYSHSQRESPALPVDPLFGAGCWDLMATELACVILSFQNEPGLVAAVQSILTQTPNVEIIVVNSGGGEAIATLRRAGINVPVVHREERLYVGAARNLGIGATQAPYVAFLAGDCVAMPGWVTGRLRSHRGGALAVASAVVNAYPENYCAWTSYILTYVERMPGTPLGKAERYGVSYARVLFDRFGRFRADLPAGEDTEFHGRFAGIVPIEWAPHVCTAHRHPVNLGSLLRDQYVRGRRFVHVQGQIYGRASPTRIARSTLRRAPAKFRDAWLWSEAGWRPFVLAASPLIMPAAAVYAFGALFARWDRPRAANHLSLPRGIWRRLRSFARWADDRLAYYWPARSRSRIIALLAFHNEMRYLPGFFENVSPHVDGIIALDDGSTDGSGDFVAQQRSVLTLLSIPARTHHVWSDGLNHRLLVEASWQHHPDWLLGLDADERVERGFRSRALREIARADRKGFLAYSVTLRDLWNAPDTYRADGIWGRKTVARFFKSRHDHEFDTRELHGHWAPLNSRRNGHFPGADLIIYHLRMINDHDRVARCLRYRTLDPDCRWQAMGYDYMIQGDGLRLEKIPPGRGYIPLGI
jgi:glycosyltransferase involved in cell wall biosynthesis